MGLLYKHEVKHLVRRTSIRMLEFGSYAVSKKSGRWAELIDLSPYYINVLSSTQLYISVRHMPPHMQFSEFSFLIEPDQSTHHDHSWKFEF